MVSERKNTGGPVQKFLRDRKKIAKFEIFHCSKIRKFKDSGIMSKFEDVKIRRHLIIQEFYKIVTV